MRYLFYFILVTGLILCIPKDNLFAANGRKIDIKQIQTAQEAYDSGFTKQVMREGESAVKLWNHELIEDDAPGSGTSNKGTFLEPVYGDRMIKKVLVIDDTRCEKAHIVFFTFGSDLNKKKPIKITFNGHSASFSYHNTEQYGYVEIEPSWLRQGENEITFACPDAKNPEDGYNFMIARADEFIAGGADPSVHGNSGPDYAGREINIIIEGEDEVSPVKPKPRGLGNRSLISTNGGKSWSVNGKGSMQVTTKDAYGIDEKAEKGGVVGEYTARLNLQQYAREGALISPVIDLWSEPDKPSALIPFTELEKLTFSFRGTAPQETNIVWQIRTGLSMDPLNEKDWSDWLTVAQGASAEYNAKGRIAMPQSHWDPERSVTLPKVRYIQWRAILSTTNPIKSPIVESVSVDRGIARRMEIPANIFVCGWHNPEIKYSSTGFSYQSADEPYNKEVVERDDLDIIVNNSASEFDAIVKLLDYASRRWVYDGPSIEYPKWNTIDISERANSVGGGGMCIQYAAYLAHILTVMGFHARHVNIQYHEVVEVWSNDFDKWVYLDPTQAVDLYMYDKKTGEPLSLYDMHKIYYRMYGVKTPIDWMKAPETWRTVTPDPKNLDTSFSTSDPRVEMSHAGWLGYFELLDFMRMMPRNDFSTTTIPEPLQQGCMQWPWDGYINWYDRLSPPKLQYSKYTDREADFWPTLNRVHFEAVPEINGDTIFITMSTFTPSFKTFQISIDGGAWKDSDARFNWNLHSGKNIIRMRAVSKFGVAGYPSEIELNFVIKHIPKTISFGTMNQ